MEKEEMEKRIKYLEELSLGTLKILQGESETLGKYLEAMHPGKFTKEIKAKRDNYNEIIEQVKKDLKIN